MNDLVYWWEFATNNSAAWFLTYLVHSTVIFGSIALIASRSRMSARSENALWRVALVLVPVTATLRIGIEHATGRDFAAGPDALMVVGALGDTLIAVLLGSTLVAFILTGRLGRAFRRERSQLSGRQPVTDRRLIEAVETIADETGCRPPILTQSDAIAAPIALRGGEVCVPGQLFGRLSSVSARAVLAHEIAHVARGDTRWIAVSQLLERIFFLQPLHRYVNRRMRETSEFLADDFAVRYTGSPEPLIGALTTFARASSRSVAVSGFAPGSLLLRRVKRVLAGNEHPVRGWIWAVVVLSLAVTTLAWFSPAVVPACDCLFLGR